MYCSMRSQAKVLLTRSTGNLKILRYFSASKGSCFSSIKTPTRNEGNDYIYENVVKDFKWKIPEYWNFAQVIRL